MAYNDVPELAPLHFFRLFVEIKYGSKVGRKGFSLPLTSDLLAEEAFANVSAAWHESGITLQVEVDKKFEEAIYPKFQEGDAIEIFFDTRDMKEAGFPTKFCHHFLILPQPVQEVQALEITRFRSDDSHELCDPEKIEVRTEILPRRYVTTIFFPAEILHGYDPASFDRLGITYTIHRPKRESQHFAVSSTYVAIGSHPSLWATAKLVRS